MLINLSNHSSLNWKKKQVSAALKQFGGIVDIPFPKIDPLGDEVYIGNLVEEYVNKIKIISDKEKPSIHIMGEMTFCYALVYRLLRLGYDCYASTTERVVIEKESNVKEVIFDFVKFRKYLI